MRKITREAIKQYASSDRVYYRGMRYYAAHAVSNVTWNDNLKQYKGVVKGSNQYIVTVAVEDDGDIQYSCNCPSHVKLSGACKHVIAMMLFVADYQQRENAKVNFNEEDRVAYNVVEYFRKREYNHLTPNYFQLKLNISIPEFMKSTNSRAYVSFEAGEHKMYKVSNTKKFINEYYNEETIELGKEFHYVPGESAFEENSAKILDYLTDIYEIQETLGKTYYSSLFKRQELILSKKMLQKLLDLSENIECDINIFGKEFKNINIVKGNPELSIDMLLDDNMLTLKKSADNKLISLCEDGSILFYDNALYLPEKEFVSCLLPFYVPLFMQNGKEIEFRSDNKNGFIEKVLPVVKKHMNISVPDEIKDMYIVEPLVPKLYLDIYHNRKKVSVTAVIKFQYGDYAINPLEENYSGKYILVRDKEEEERLTRVLYDLNFKINDSSFILRNEEDIFNMMTDNRSILTDNFEVFYSKEYKNINVKKIGHMSANIRLNTDINLLEMDMEYSQVPKDELEEFFRAVHLKKKYYRLKNGAFISLEDDKQKKTIEWLVENSVGDSNGILKFQENAAVYIDEIMPDSQSVERDDGFKKLIREIKNPGVSEYEVPECVQAKMREYQVVGYRWLKNLARYSMGGILADDMGLGKTLQTIVYICSEPGSKSLIVCPTSLSYNWQEEFEKFAPHIRTRIISGDPEERKRLLCEDRDDYDVWITTYPLIRKDADFFKDIRYDNMFIDEAQFIKNPASLGAKAVKSVVAEHRFALTGTPIENTLSELWSIFDFIMPGFLSRYSKFAEHYEKPILKEKNESRMQELKRRIQPFILRRMKKDVLKDLPDKIETKRISEMTAKQKKIYISYLSRIQSEIMDNSDIQSGKDRIQVLAALTRLRQICCHPGTFIENYHGGSGKLELLMEQLPDIIEGGHSVIIFSQFTSMLSIIADELRKSEIPYFYLVGATKPEERKKYVKEFNRGEVKVFLISLNAGGTGLNLTGADTVIHFDPWWNPAVEEQATDRAYRIGQKRKVQVIKYVTKDSIEEKIYELQKRKKVLSDSVIEADELFVNNLTKDEILELFK